MADKKKWLTIPVLLIGIVILLAVWLFSGYNRLVGLDEGVSKTFANIETQLQRRFDLIPNLQGIVEGAADFEQSTFTAVTQARNQFNAAGTTEGKIEAANQFESALSRLLVTFENYPQLQATQAFRDFMTQLEGTENRISVERTRYNEAATSYNTVIRRVPTNIIAGLFGFERHELYDAVAEADTAPQVEFDFGS
jgi:LemA protein